MDQVRKQSVPPIVVSCSEFGGFRQEILNSIRGIKVSFQIAKKAVLLKHEEVRFFTYDCKTERLFKVILKGLSNDYKLPEEI